MQGVLLYHKAMNGREEQHQWFYQMENMALQLAKSNQLPKQCLLDGDNANKAISVLRQQQGCSLSAGQYQYIIEEIDDFPCLVTMVNHKKLATHHRRVTIHDDKHSFLQIRYVSAVMLKEQCLTKSRFIPTGVSSWRLLTDRL